MNQEERQFVRMVTEYYARAGRHTLPWRRTRNPYRILVSELMLQQTQVDRVIPKYRSFLRRFPTMKSLEHASLGDVIREWQGLGYNRRAKMLHSCARKIVHDHTGRLPKTQQELMALPGIGHYTAGAIMAFAYNIPVPIIETNIRTVFIHHFFGDETDVPDRDIVRLIERFLDRKNPRTWYYALMDYGAYLKKTVGNQNVRSKQYTKQSTFKGSDRQIRGMILKLLTQKHFSRKQFHTQLPFDVQRIDEQLTKLTSEGLIDRKGNIYSLPK